MPNHPFSRFLMAAAALACCCVGQPTRAYSAPASEYEVKAGLIYNFAKFVDWPPIPGDEVRLCIFGHNPFGAVFETLRNRPVKERKLAVAYIDSMAQMADCQIVYLAATLDKHLGKIAEQARGKGILLVSDTEGFGRRGSMINLYLEDDKVRFEINHAAIQGSGLAVSSKLLSLGRPPK